jgi:hypothetical protein
MKSRSPRRTGVPRRRSVALRVYRNIINSAQGAIFFAAILLVVDGLFSFLSIRFDEGSQALSGAVYIYPAAHLLIAVVFLVLGFWSRKDPYTAALTALILFISFIILSAVCVFLFDILETLSFLEMVVLKIMVISVLRTGVRYSHRYHRLKAKEEIPE